MTKKIHYFNPGHETAILLDIENYTAPANVQRMTKELSLLPMWYAEPGDYVLVDDTSFSLYESLQQNDFPHAMPVRKKEIGKQITDSPEAMPWGLSPHSVALFEKLKKDDLQSITVPLWKNEYKQLAGRQTAANCLDKLQKLLPDFSLPTSPRFCMQMQEIEKYITLCSAPFVLKTPYSSSGRGIYWINTRKLNNKDKAWINGGFNKQGTVSIERGLDKVQDFAMEFYSDGKGQIQYQGLSLFGTGESGAYSGNILQSQNNLQAILTNYTGKEKLQQIQDAVCQVLQETYGSIYTGYLGIDMLIYKENNGNYAIHPCIEINMRYTMGMVAIRLFQKYMQPDTIGDFRITYNNEPGEAYEHHCFMQDAYPLILENGKIKEGYLSLCPVTQSMHYRAYILVI